MLLFLPGPKVGRADLFVEGPALIFILIHNYISYDINLFLGCIIHVELLKEHMSLVYPLNEFMRDLKTLNLFANSLMVIFAAMELVGFLYVFILHTQ